MTSKPYSFSLTMKGVEQDFPQLFVAYSIINLSNNKLQSEIPFIIRSLISLKVLDLSHNSLTGRIPQGKQFNTFEGNSFVGNPNRCGPPLRKKCNEHPQESQLESDGAGGDEESGLRGKWWRWDMYVGHYMDW
ncbi:leucine-rich repeat-containing protein [Tanacetum coccineum]